MQVQYIFNSCFIITLDNHILLFDYYKGTLPTLDPNKPLYVFVSHSHSDHYNPEIYTINHPNITYILSDDVDNIGNKIKPHMHITIDDIDIQTLLSTDLGVAFAVKVENKYIYHAGDLHWWHWFGEPEADNQYQKETFMQEINIIKDIPFSLMMVPLDPRLEEATPWGMQYILEHVETTYMFPMHFFMQTKKMLEYLQQPPLSLYNNSIIPIHHKGEIFTLK
jgi:L-ascorbate metabolism protein UlaG (beta-lactamase superfamily)